MTRHKVVVILDLEDDDQSDDEALVDVVSYWVRLGRERDFEYTGMHWPPPGPPTPDNSRGDPNANWKVEYQGAQHIKKEAV